MKTLTKEQLKFLNEYYYHLKYLFDAKNLAKSEYKIIMKELNKFIAFNTTPCKKFGHTLRTRSGHCCQCNTAYLEFQKRNDSEGIVYVTVSLKGKVTKLGYTKAIEVRSESLNRTKYANLNNWEILFAIKSKDAGKIENKITTLLKQYLYSLDYDHDGHQQYSTETFLCSFTTVKDQLIKTCVDNDYAYEIIQLK